ncbi:MAG TPA: helix-turn-helix domain-containing protein [Streptosporangiaceae bacterium]
MRYLNGRRYYTIGEVAEATGVSSQTVRDWERLGRVAALRTAGGHRLFSDDALRMVSDQAARSRRRRVSGREPSAPGSADVNWELASTGARLRAAREDHGLSQAELASRVGISRSVLSALERGIYGASAHVFSKIAEVLGIPMSSLAPARPTGQYLMRAGQRPETLLGRGVRWLELAAPGHSMAPALLLTAPGADSGGFMTLTRENFVTVLDGTFQVRLSGQDDWITLEPGDSLVLAPGQAHAWRNPSRDQPAKALWVEQLAAPLAPDGAVGRPEAGETRGTGPRD